MDLGNINLRAPASSPSGDQGGAKSQKKSGEAPAEGGFAGLIASLLAAARGEAKPAGEVAQAHGTMVKAAGAPPAQGLAADAAAVQAASITGGGENLVTEGEAVIPLGNIQTKAGEAAAQTAHPKMISPAASAKAGAIFLKLEKPLSQTITLASEAADDGARADIKPQTGDVTVQNPNAANIKNQNAAVKDALASAAPKAASEKATEIQPAPSRESADFAVRQTAGAAPSSSVSESAGAKPSAPGAQSSSQTVVMQVAQQLTNAVRGGMQHIRFQLHPAELGQVSIQLKIRDGAAKVVITADNPAAVESMRQAAGALHQSLQSAGVQLDRDNLSFQQQDGGGAAADQFASGDEARRHDGGDNASDDAAYGGRRQETDEQAPSGGKESGLFL